MLDTLPDACPNDAYWSLGKLVHRRDNIMKQRVRLVNQLHEQLCMAYPTYKTFFSDIGRTTALYFWENYPSRKYLRGMTAEDARDMVTLGIISDIKHYDEQLKEVQHSESIMKRNLQKERMDSKHLFVFHEDL